MRSRNRLASSVWRFSGSSGSLFCSNAARSAGRRLATALSPYLVETSVSEKNFTMPVAPMSCAGLPTVQPDARRSDEFARSPIVTHAVAVALLAALICGLSLTSLGFLAISCLMRWATAGATARILRLPVAGLWLLPLRDLLSFAVFIGSFCGRSVSWRDQLFRIEPGGRIVVDGDGTLMKTLFLYARRPTCLDGGAGSRYQAKREIRSF